jgi:hypothetical protein
LSPRKDKSVQWKSSVLLVYDPQIPSKAFLSRKIVGSI